MAGVLIIEGMAQNSWFTSLNQQVDQKKDNPLFAGIDKASLKKR